MAVPVDPPRSPAPPLAQLLATAALQRQTALVAADAKPGISSAQVEAGDAGAATPFTPLPSSQGALPAPSSDRAFISPQARQQLGATLGDPRPWSASARSQSADNGRVALPRGAPAGMGAAAHAGREPPLSAAPTAAGVAWPASGLAAPTLALVRALVAQVTAQAGLPQRVVAAQPWPLGLAQALESGLQGADVPPLQTWLVRQGVVSTPGGPMGLALTLRAPVPWLSSQVLPAASAHSAQPGLSGGAGAPLQAAFAGSAQALRSGVFALVLGGTDSNPGRTSALLVLDMQPSPIPGVYGRELLMAPPPTGRLDPWTQMAVLQASGQVPTDEERARHGGGSHRPCETPGCLYLARATCVQPFCPQLRGISAVPAA